MGDEPTRRITFSAPMLEAIASGRKTETRRLRWRHTPHGPKESRWVSARPGCALLAAPSPFHPPRCRLVLLEVELRPLRPMSMAELLAEGVRELPGGMWSAAPAKPRLASRAAPAAFASLWDHLHKHRPGMMWVDNPAVVVLRFALAGVLEDVPGA